MMTFRILTNSGHSQCSVFLAATLAFVSVFVGESCFAIPLTKAPQVPAKHNPTPDPYFSNSNAKATNSGFVARTAPAQTSSSWEAPLTPVGNKSNATPFQPAASQLTQLTSIPGTTGAKTTTPIRSASMLSPKPTNQFAVEPMGSNSIIRQPSTGFSASANQSGFQSAGPNKQSFESSNGVGSEPASQTTSFSSPTNTFASTSSEPPQSNSNSFGAGSVARPSSNSNVQAAWAPSTHSTINTTSNSQETFEPGKVLAIVGGEPLLVGDILFEVNQMMEKAMGSAPPEVKARERKKAIPMLLPQFVQNKLLYMGTLRQLPDGADVESVLEQAGKEFDDNALDKMMKGAGIRSIAEFDAHLRGHGSSLRKLRLSWSKDQLTRFFLSKQIKFNEDVTHQEMLDEYRKNLTSYANPAKCRWEQIMIRFDRSDSPLAAKAKIKELGNQLVYGANLAATAKKSSHGYLAFEGGQHDWTTKGSLVLKELDQALFSLPIRELSDIIQTQDGYHIVRVLERTEASHTPFLEAQVKIKKRILKERRDEAFKVHIEKLESEIPVEYLVFRPD